MSYLANLFVFILSIFVIGFSLFDNHADIANSISVIIGDQNVNSSNFSSWIVLAFFAPILIYLVKLYLSLASVEHNPDNYKKYLCKLNKPIFIFENIVRLLIYCSFLMLAANLINWIPVFFDKVLNIQLIGYGLKFDRIHEYTVPIKGFPSLIPILSFNVLFFVVLMIWDLTVYFGNWISKNKLNGKEFFKRFIFHHIFGFIIWVSLLYLLLTFDGYSLLGQHYMLIFSILSILLVGYIITLFISLWGLGADLKLTIIEEVELKP